MAQTGAGPGMAIYVNVNVKVNNLCMYDYSTALMLQALVAQAAQES